MKKFCKNHYIYNGVISFLSPAIMIYLLLGPTINEDGGLEFSNTQMIILIVSLIACLLLIIAYNIVLYHKSGYSIDKNGVTTKTGVFFKRTSVLTYNKMHAINKRQNIIQKLFNDQALYIDSGSTNTASQAEIKIYGTPKEIEEISTLVDNYKNNLFDQGDEEIQVAVKEDKQLIFKYSKLDKFKYILISLISVLIIMAIGSFLAISIMLVIRKLQLEAVGIILTISIFSLILCFISTALFSFIGLYAFTLYKSENDLFINYGLLTKVNNRLPLNKIKAVRISQGIIQRLFGFASMRVDVVGYNDFGESTGSKTNNGMLIPFCKYEEIKKYLDNILPVYDALEPKEKSKYLFPHFSVPLLVIQIFGVFIAGSLLAMAYDKGVISNTDNIRYMLIATLCVVICDVLLSVFSILLAILAKKNNTLSFDDEKMTMTTGSLIKHIVTVKKENVIAIENMTTHLRKRKGIYSYYIHIFSNSMQNVIKVKILDENINEKLLYFLKDII